MKRNNEYKKCPKCGGPLGKRPALSRRDNKTDICSECGAREAIEDAEKIMKKCEEEAECQIN